LAENNNSGLFARIFRSSPENPSTSLSNPAAWLTGLFGTSKTGVQVSEDNALTFSAVYAAVRIISETIASIPLNVYQADGETRVKAVGHPVQDLLAKAPNSVSSTFTFREAMASNLVLHGNAYAKIEMNAAGRPTALIPLNPMKVEVKVVDGEKVYVFDKKHTYLDYEILHFVGLSFNGLTGKSPLSMAREAVAIGLAAQEYGARFYSNGANAGGVITAPGRLNTEVVKRLRESWNRAQSGNSNSHSTAILEEGMKYEKIGLDPEAAQFLQSRKFQVNERARIFRIPPSYLADLENSSTRANVEQQAIQFVRDCITPYVRRMEVELNRKLFREDEPNLYAYFTMEGLMRGDLQGRYDAYATARQWGWLSVNDIRDLENLNPVEGGDIYLQPLNMVQSGQDDTNVDAD
jgi:HK97 family phage portal protein